MARNPSGPPPPPPVDMEATWGVGGRHSSLAQTLERAGKQTGRCGAPGTQSAEGAHCVHALRAAYSIQYAAYCVRSVRAALGSILPLEMGAHTASGAVFSPKTRAPPMEPAANKLVNCVCLRHCASTHFEWIGRRPTRAHPSRWARRDPLHQPSNCKIIPPSRRPLSAIKLARPARQVASRRAGASAASWARPTHHWDPQVRSLGARTELSHGRLSSAASSQSRRQSGQLARSIAFHAAPIGLPWRLVYIGSNQFDLAARLASHKLEAALSSGQIFGRPLFARSYKSAPLSRTLGPSRRIRRPRPPRWAASRRA